MSLVTENNLEKSLASSVQPAMNTKDDDAKAEAEPARGGLIDEKLFNSRAITIFGEINDKLARSVTERLLALAAENDEPISIYISSPGVT